jgi:hypothetical protein
MTCPQSLDPSLAGVFGVLTLADTVLFFASALGWIWFPAVVVGHCILIAVVIVWLAQRDVTNWGLWLIGLVATFVAGPLGAVGVIALAAIRQHTSPSQDLLEEWYRRMSGESVTDPAHLIHDAILTDRALRPGAGASQRFADLMKHGALSEKQALLGLIGLKYHNDYFPILAMGLRAREASVRAQAAAVFVKLKDQFKRRLKESLVAPAIEGETGATAEGLTRADIILTCAQTGFIDSAEAREACAVAKTLCEQALATGVMPDEAEALLCRVLAANSEHEELVSRLTLRTSTLAPDLKTLLAGSLIELGRHRELHALLRAVPEAPMRV